jgi:threonine dehydrogenase-like Zn-dependent dehydrogenase
VGLSATKLAVEMGARVIAIDIAPERRKLAQQFGAAEVIDPTARDMVAAIRELTHSEGAHKTWLSFWLTHRDTRDLLHSDRPP